jgi:hypothetical protein
MFLSASGIATLDREGHSAVYDLRGNQVLPSEHRDGAALWAGRGSLLVFGEAGITGYSMSSRKGTVLGENRVAGYCSWNATKLVCPTKDGISMWTYAFN